MKLPEAAKQVWARWSTTLFLRIGNGCGRHNQDRYVIPLAKVQNRDREIRKPNAGKLVSRRRWRGVRPVRARMTRAKCDALRKPARLPISAVVTRLNNEEVSMRNATCAFASINFSPKVSPAAAYTRCRVRTEISKDEATSAAVSCTSVHRWARHSCARSYRERAAGVYANDALCKPLAVRARSAPT